MELAFLLGRRRNSAALERGLDGVAAAQALRGLSRVAQARLAHAEGYILYQQGRERLPIAAYNRAIAMFPKDHHLRPRVFDSFGQYFQHTAGDLDRARAYYELSYAEKQTLADRYGMAAMWEGLAITAGNLGRLELTLERWAEAERWTKIDLDLEERHGEASLAETGDLAEGSIQERQRARAMLHGQLARIAIGRGGRVAEAQEHLSQAFALVPPASYTEVTLWFDTARLALQRGERVDAERAVARADELARGGGFEQLLAHVQHVRGLVLAEGVDRATDPRFTAACAELDEAMSKFAALNQPQDLCDVIRDKAALLLRGGRRDEARRLVLERGIDVAERSLFGQLQPLARLESLLTEIDAAEVAQMRQRRMRGGIPAEEHTGRLRGERRQITVWTCDIRGFAAYCDAHDDAEVVATLNRFFRSLGEPILDARGYIDKYVGDNILAYFTSPSTAVGIALKALQIVEHLNTEWEHLHKDTLDIGVGVATGDAIVGSVGFAGKLEHTIIGSTVNLACRLVGVAGPREVAIDAATARAVGGEFRTEPWNPRGLVPLKGFGEVPVWRLLGRRERPRAGRRRAG